MRHRVIALMVIVLVTAACGDDDAATTTTVAATTITTTTTAATTTSSSTTTTTAPTTTTTVATTTTLRPESAWFGALTAGDCYLDALDEDGDFDFSVPPRVVDCREPHDNEVVAIVELGAPDDGFPGSAVVETLAVEGCDAEFAEFLGGRSFDEVPIEGFYVWPDEVDWQGGVRSAVCSVFSTSLVGTAALAPRWEPTAVLTVLAEIDGVVDVWLVDDDGELDVNLTDDDVQEVLNPVAWDPLGESIAYGVVEGNDIWTVRIDAPGAAEPLLSGPDDATSPDFSPDGSMMLFVSDRAGTGDLDLFVLEPATGAVLPLTDDPDRDSSPEYSPDGSQIVFRGRRAGNSDIYVMDADGTNVVRLTQDPAFEGDPAWTPDGERIVFISDRTGNFDVYVMNADGSGLANLTEHPADDEYPDVDPTGRWVAFHSNRLGGINVFVVGVDGSNQTLVTGYGPTGYPQFAPAP